MRWLSIFTCKWFEFLLHLRFVIFSLRIRFVPLSFAEELNGIFIFINLFVLYCLLIHRIVVSWDKIFVVDTMNLFAMLAKMTVLFKFCITVTNFAYIWVRWHVSVHMLSHLLILGKTLITDFANIFFDVIVKCLEMSFEAIFRWKYLITVESTNKISLFTYV